MSDIRQRIDQRFMALGHWIYRNRFKTLLGMLVFLGSLFSQLPKIGFDASDESYFHEGDTTLADYTEFRDQFGNEDTIVVLITPEKLFDVAFLEQLTAFHQALDERVPYREDVFSLVNVRHTRGEGDTLVVGDLLERIPRTEEEMAAFRERVLASELYRDSIIDQNATMTLVIVELLAFSPTEDDRDLLDAFAEGEDPAAETDTAAGPQEPVAPAARLALTDEEIREAVSVAQEVVNEFNGPDFPIKLTGGAPFNDFFNRTMPVELFKFSGLALIAIGVLLVLLFRRFTGLILPILVVIISLLATLGLMFAAGLQLTMPTMILPRFLLAVGLATAVHLLVLFFRDYQQSQSRENAIAYALGHSGLPIVMTGLTTSAGMFAFSTSEMAPVAHLGVFAGLGMFIVLLNTLVLIPALLAIWPLRPKPRFAKITHGQTFDRMMGVLADFVTRRAVAIVLVSGVLLSIAIVGVFGLRFSLYFLGWLPKDLELRVAIEEINGAMNGADLLEIIIDTGEENGLYDPEIIAGIDALAQFALAQRKPDGRIMASRVNSVVDVLKETHRALNGNDQAFYRLPEDRELIAQELLLFENSGSDDLEDLVDSLFNKARLTITVPLDDGSVYVDFVAKMEEEAQAIFGDRAEVTVTGALNLFTQMIHAMNRSLGTSYLIAAVVITVLMMILVGSVRLGALSMVVNFLPILLTMGIVMRVFDKNLDISTLLLGGIALGLAVDDTIHFFHNFRRYFGQTGDVREAVRRTLMTAGRALFFTTLVLVTGFWFFMFSIMQNHFYFGLLTGVTLLFALLADFIVAPALLTLVIRTRYGRSLAKRWSRTAGRQMAGGRHAIVRG